MEPKKTEITQEMLEPALLCCADDDPAPAGEEPCAGCYLQQLNLVKEGHVSTGETCFKHLALDVIDYIRKINDFEHSQCADLLKKLEKERTENKKLRKAVELAVEESYGVPAPPEIVNEIMQDAQKEEDAL